MRLISTETVKAGVVLARSIYSNQGQILLSSGVQLSEKMIERLNMMGIPYIYIEDTRTDDIAYEEMIPREMKQEALISIESTFKKVQEAQSIPNSIVIENASKKFIDIVRALHSEIRSNEDLLSILSDVYTYDNYIFKHSFNVTLYSLAIGLELGLSQKDLEVLGLGAMLHDVGKMNVPLEILSKQGKLTVEEFEIIKRHTVEGYDILRNVKTMSLIVAHCAFQHHERLNGSGYPRGIIGEEIHLFGKIIAVADVFDAVTTNRMYRKAMLPHIGLEILFTGTGTLFDENIVKAFRRAVAIYPIGLTVELSDGRKGVISKQNIGMNDRPIVRIMNEHGREIEPYDIDLKNEPSVVITKCETAM